MHYGLTTPGDSPEIRRCGKFVWPNWLSDPDSGAGNGLHKTSEKAKVSRRRTCDKNYLRETFTTHDAYAFRLWTSVFLLLRYNLHSQKLVMDKLPVN